MNRTMMLLSVLVPALAAGCARHTATTSPQPGATPAAPVAVRSDGKGLELLAVRNACVFFYPGEATMNGGGCHRLRTRNIGQDNGEVALIDFNREALKTFLDKNRQKTVAGKLVLAIRDLQDGPVKLEVAALDTASEWTEGNKNQQQADKGEVCFGAAQFDAKPWTTADGRSVSNLGQLLCDAKRSVVKTLLNPGAVTVSDADKLQSVSVDLDGKFVEHLAVDPNCRGIVVFTRTPKGKVYFSSRDKPGKEPRLVLTAQ